jgi:amidase
LKPLTKRLKIGVFVDPPTKKAIDPEVAAAVMQAAKLLRELGHQVDEIACPVPEYVVEEFLSLWSWVSFAQPRSGLLARGKGFTLDKLEPWTHAFAERFKQRKWGVLREAYRLRRYTRDYVQHMAGYDVLLCPTTGEVAPKLGHLSPSVPFDEALARVLTFTPFAASFNASGVPAISLPLGQSAGKVPIGVHFAAGMNQEQLLLELALELEAARPWVKLAPRLQ